MVYSNDFSSKSKWLKSLDSEALNDALNEMSFDELLALRDYMIQQELREKDLLLSEEERQKQLQKLLQMTREPETKEDRHRKTRFLCFLSRRR